MQLPARIGKYELEEFLGGGMSHVYRARDTVIGRTVAVKVLTEAGCQDADTKARFLAEARMAGNISHDNVLRVYDFGEDDQHKPFMVMEFLRGQDLRNAIRGGTAGDLRSKLKIALQIARALEYIHAQKIIHRDIKPENVHIDGSGVVKLMDFGIAKTEGLGMTRAGYVLGTPYYMAPEQVTGQNITSQVDVYSFGILLFELMTGQKPISGDTVERIFFSILNEPLKLDPLTQAGAPQGVVELVRKCTLKGPAERPQGFAPVCAELERIIAVHDAPTVMMEKQPAPPPPPSRPAWLLPAVGAAILVLAVALYFALRPQPELATVSGRPALAKTITTPTGEMVLVAEGPFESGKDKRQVPVPAFYIDKTEVTNRAYQTFSQASNWPLPRDFAPDKPDYPVVNVSILDAQQFAKWAGKRLPTAREWEKAARGSDGRQYPWGNEKEPSRANAAGTGIVPVNGYDNGASPSGALQMAGNVWEFVYEMTAPEPRTVDYFKDRLTPSPTAAEPWYQIRGGSFTEALQDGLLWDYGVVPAQWKNPNIGFRCVKDPE
jgi:eukaryotic-like serine/threonine-protein kinase